MSKRSDDPTTDFQNMAKQSLHAWQQMWSQAAGQTPGAFSAAQPESSAPENMQRVLDGLKGYLGWMENLSAASAATPGGLPWNDAFGQAFGAAVGNPFSEAFAEVPGMGSLDPQQWQQQFMKTMAPMQQAMSGAFSMPTFGMAREHQEQSQAMGRAWMEYRQQSARHQALVARVGRVAAELVQDKLAVHEEPGRQIESMRGLYNLWVDAAEEAWAEIAMSDEYREVYAAMTNAQMRVRQLVQQQVAEAGSQLGMPTREEVDTLGRRLQELRREIAELRGTRHDKSDPTEKTGSTAGKRAKPRQKPAASRKSAGKKAVSKKATSKKTSSKKTSSKKTASTKASSKKVASKKSASKSAASKRTASKKAASKKAASKTGRKSVTSKRKK